MIIMNTALISSESESDFSIILELSKKLNLKTVILSEDDGESFSFKLSGESSLTEWLSQEENEAWKNL